LSSLPDVCVVDASVAIKLCIAQPDSDLAQALFDHLADNPSARFHVPDFFYVECASALANYVRVIKYPIDAARQGMQRLLALQLRVAPSVTLAGPALDIANTCRISGYDACYVALAQQLDIPLITADEKLVNALSNRPYPVQLLAAFRT
jgi:predicted nucleic acid-binding protein